MKKAKKAVQSIKSNMFTPYYEDCLIASSILLLNSLFVVFVWAENHSREHILTNPTNGLSMVNSSLFVVFVWAENHSREQQIRTSPTNGRSMVNVGKTLASNLRYVVGAHNLVAKTQNILDYNTAYYILIANRYKHNRNKYF